MVSKICCHEKGMKGAVEPDSSYPKQQQSF
jgi:hypothetical protein